MLAKQNFSSQAEEALCQQIAAELSASYIYMSMATYFDRDDVALKNVSKFFTKQSDEERQHASMLIEYVNKRGGVVKFYPIEAPDTEWKSCKFAFETALKLEKDVNQSLLNLVKIADDHGDLQMSDYITSVFLAEQVDSIKEFSEFISQLNLAGDGLGVYMFDQNLKK